MKPCGYAQVSAFRHLVTADLELFGGPVKVTAGARSPDEARALLSLVESEPFKGPQVAQPLAPAPTVAPTEPTPAPTVAPTGAARRARRALTPRAGHSRGVLGRPVDQGGRTTPLA